MTGMDTFDFVVIGAGPAGEAATHKARALGATRGGRRPALVRRVLPAHRLRPVQEPAARGGAPLERRGLLLGAGLGAARLHGQPPRRRRRARRHVPRQGARGRRRRRVPGRGPDHGPRRRHRHPRRDGARGARAERRRRGRVDVQGAAARGPRRRPALDQPRGDADPRAPAEPGRPRRRADGLRARAGLCAVRRPGDGLPVRAPARAHGPPAQRRDDPLRARARRRHRADRRASRPRPGRRGPRRPARDRPRRRDDRRRARDPARRRTRRARAATSVSSTTAWPAPDPTPTGATARCAWRTACGSPAIPRAPSSTPTRPTTRASSWSGWRWARRSSPTTAPCPARRTWTRRRRPWA